MISSHLPAEGHREIRLLSYRHHCTWHKWSIPDWFTSVSFDEAPAQECFIVRPAFSGMRALALKVRLHIIFNTVARFFRKLHDHFFRTPKAHGIFKMVSWCPMMDSFYGFFHHVLPLTGTGRTSYKFEKGWWVSGCKFLRDEQDRFRVVHSEIRLDLSNVKHNF